MISYARARLPPRGYADVNLVIRHKAHRKHIDGWIAANLPEAETLTIGSDGGSHQIRIWKGTVLTAVLDSLSKHGIYNAQLLRVLGWTDQTLALQCCEGGETYSVPRSWAEHNLRHGSCITYAAIQARTCHGTVQLLDWSSRRFTRRHLVMGLSRATAIGQVWLGAS